MKVSDSILERIGDYHAKLDQAPGTWPAKRELAAAVRELMDCLCATDASEAELRAIAEQVRRSARRFSGQPRMLNPPGVAEGSLAGGMEMFMDRSPVMGLANPIAPPASFEPDHEAGVVRGRVRFGNAYEGAPGCVHGGYVAAVFDEALGMACIFSGGPGMTGEITIRYRKPTPTHTDLRVEARFEHMKGRKITISGTLHAGEVLVAESTGLFIAIDRGKFAALREAQLQRQRAEGTTGSPES